MFELVFADLIKGGLISESYSLSQKMSGTLSIYREDAQDSDLAHFFGGWDQSKTISKNNPPLPDDPV